MYKIRALLIFTLVGIVAYHGVQKQALHSWALVKIQTVEVIKPYKQLQTENVLPSKSMLLTSPKAGAVLQTSLLQVHSLHYQCCARKHPGLNSFQKLTLCKYCNKINNAAAYPNTGFLQVINYKGKFLISCRK